MSDETGVFREDGFGRKLGPLPIWGWAIVLAAVVFIYVRFIGGRGSAGASSAGGSASAAYPNVMTTGGYLPAGQGSGSQPVGMPPAMFTDNTAWENAAIQSASQFGSDPLSLQQAIDQYFKGSAGQITSNQKSLLNRVIEAIGAPPIGSANGGTPAVSDPNVTPPSRGNLISFIRSPNGSIAALFDNGTISEYNSMAQFNKAHDASGGLGLVGVSATQYAQYHKAVSNYVPGS